MNICKSLRFTLRLNDYHETKLQTNFSTLSGNVLLGSSLLKIQRYLNPIRNSAKR